MSVEAPPDDSTLVLSLSYQHEGEGDMGDDAGGEDMWIMISFNKISSCERMWNVDAFHTQSLNFINGNDYDDDIASFTLSKVLPFQRAGHPLR